MYTFAITHFFWGLWVVCSFRRDSWTCCLIHINASWFSCFLSLKRLLFFLCEPSICAIKKVNPVRLCKLILVDLTYRAFNWIIVPWLQLMHLKWPQLENNPTIELSLIKNDACLIIWVWIRPFTSSGWFEYSHFGRIFLVYFWVVTENELTHVWSFGYL